MPCPGRDLGLAPYGSPAASTGSGRREGMLEKSRATTESSLDSP
jgi:hypothetical protein